jgi:hypothetical protein
MSGNRVNQVFYPWATVNVERFRDCWFSVQNRSQSHDQINEEESTVAAWGFPSGTGQQAGPSSAHPNATALCPNPYSRCGPPTSSGGDSYDIEKNAMVR